MILFPNGILITQTESQCLLHVETNPEQCLRDALLEKARLRRNALISEWRPRLFADASVTTMPGTEDGLITMILARDDYKRSN